MFKNHITIAIRTLLRHKVYSFVNISGLAVGLACCMLIMLFVQDELSYDQFHKNANQIYRVLWNARYGDNEWTIPYVSVPISETLKERFPQVAHSTRLRRESQTIRRESNYVIEKNFYYAESSFFDVFTVPFIAGDPATALNAPNAVILTEQSAQRYFPNRDPMGQTLELNDGTSLQVTGVVKAFPPQSHFHFDFLAPIKTLPIIERRKSAWGSATVYTYLMLKDGASASELQTKFTAYVREHILSKMPPMPGYHTNYLIQPVTDIHLHSNLLYEITANSNIMYIYIFSLIAIFVLLLACINFVNLSTARSSNPRPRSRRSKSPRLSPLATHLPILLRIHHLRRLLKYSGNWIVRIGATTAQQPCQQTPHNGQPDRAPRAHWIICPHHRRRPPIRHVSSTLPLLILACYSAQRTHHIGQNLSSQWTGRPAILHFHQPFGRHVRRSQPASFRTK